MPERFQRHKNMKIIAQSKSATISPRKARLVADAIRGHLAKKALDELLLINKRGASIIIKTLKSAITNAVHNAKASEESLMIKSIEVSEGSAFKRYHPSTRGRTHPYKKRTSNIKIVLEEKEK